MAATKSCLLPLLSPKRGRQPRSASGGGGGDIRAQQQYWFDIRGVGCFANRCGCLFYFYVPGFGFGGFQKAAKCTNGNPTAPPGRVSSPEPWQVVDGVGSSEDAVATAACGLWSFRVSSDEHVAHILKYCPSYLRTRNELDTTCKAVHKEKRRHRFNCKLQLQNYYQRHHSDALTDPN